MVGPVVPRGIDRHVEKSYAEQVWRQLKGNKRIKLGNVVESVKSEAFSENNDARKPMRKEPLVARADPVRTSYPRFLEEDS